ncbi:hypothetical protein SS41_23140 [Enterobacter hormaechei subsp. xiangfangensis]|uniref:hypothetical protein n=1 Tax=Enterobacter hormaechei TaxID=158836 RepID=UPI0005EFE8F4|nr:hypothetical protein [Enterobacter hormaechei]KJN19153.1 hypothetical protein SS41_23140 [Enterobacter hormaechei subsp. xiangfangensis]
MNTNKIKLIALSSLFFLPSVSYADDVNIAEMLANTSSATHSVMILINGLALLVGLVFAGGALFKFRDLARHPNSSETVTAPALMMLASVCLIQFVTTMQTGGETLGSTGELFSLTSNTHTNSGNEIFENALNALLLMVKGLGMFATFRAFTILYYSQAKNKEIEWAKFFALLISGFLAIHIEYTISIFLNTFGIHVDFLNFS